MATKKEFKSMSKPTRKILKRLNKYVLKHWGKRCPDYEEKCWICKIYHLVDQFEGMVEDDV